MDTSKKVHSQIQSFGLIYGPDFFEIHSFSDREGKNWIQSETKTLPAIRPDGLTQVNPLYALLFNANWTLIPDSIFEEADAGKFLAKTTGFQEENRLDFEKSPGLELVLVYERNSEFEDFTTQINPGLKAGNLTAVLLEFCRRKIDHEGNMALLFCSENLASLIIFSKGALLFANSIEFKKTEDLLYFTFFTSNKLDVPNHIPFVIMGSQKMGSAVQEELKMYFSNIKIQTGDAHLAEVLSEICA